MKLNPCDQYPYIRQIGMSFILAQSLKTKLEREKMDGTSDTLLGGSISTRGTVLLNHNGLVGIEGSCHYAEDPA